MPAVAIFFLAVGVPTDRNESFVNSYLVSMNLFHKRQGQMDVNLCYFYTDTIIDFKHLLADDALKMIVISSLQYLVEKESVTIYGYVIMPNHIHLLWYIKEQNGKENTAASFTKFTAHQFKKQLRI